MSTSKRDIPPEAGSEDLVQDWLLVVDAESRGVEEAELPIFDLLVQGEVRKLNGIHKGKKEIVRSEKRKSSTTRRG